MVCSLYCDMVWENMNASHTHHTHTYTHTVWHHVNNTVMQSVACVCVCPWAAPLLQLAATVTSQGYSAQTSSLWRCVVLVQGGAWGNVWGWGRGHAMTQWIGVCVISHSKSFVSSVWQMQILISSLHSTSLNLFFFHHTSIQFGFHLIYHAVFQEMTTKTSSSAENLNFLIAES